MKIKPLKFLTISAVIAALYWGVAHCNWIIFKNTGVTPMPFWPAASVALLSGLYYGWNALTGLIIGAFLTNHITIGGPILQALGISVMNSLAPVCGALLIRKITPTPIDFMNIPKPATVILIACIAIPFGTAAGGMTTKYLFGLIQLSAIPKGLLQWMIADMLGIILLTIPYLTWFDRSIETRKGF